MKRISNATTLALAGLLASAITMAVAQSQPSQQPPDSVVAVVADAQGLPLVPPDQIPFFGTFWEVRSSLPCLTAPLPFPPFDTNTPVYAIGDPGAGGQFLVDETGGQVISPQIRSSRRVQSMDSTFIVQAQVTELQNFIAQVQANQAAALLRANGLMDGLTPEDQDGPQPGPMGLDSCAPGTLWLSISEITNGVAPLIIHGTVPDVLYEIWSKQTLTDTVWFLEGSVPGAADQDWTPTTVTVGTRTNSLFMRCRSWVSSNGSGIPDWWLLQYGLPLDTDPYSLGPSGDGWTILQAWQNGWNPNLFYAPPPPKNVAVRLDSTGTNATITWESGGGPVTNYTILTGPWGEVAGQVDANTFTFPYQWPSYAAYFVPNRTFTVRAYFANGAYADSIPASAAAPGLNSSMAATRGPAGQLYLCVSPVPPDLASVRVFWEAWDDALGDWVYRSTDLEPTAFTNGAARLPLGQMTGYWPFGYLEAQCLGANGAAGALSGMWPYPDWSEEVGWDVDAPALGFAAAQVHLKENLKFHLASATVSQPFSCLTGVWTGFSGGPSSASLDFPQIWYEHNPSAGDYEYSGYHTFSPSLNLSFQEELRPVRENYLWRNLTYDSADLDASGYWASWVGYERSDPGLRQIYDPKYQFTCTNCNPLPLAQDLTNHPDIFARWVPNLDALQFSNELAEIGVAVSGTNIYLPSGVRNVYGLSLDLVRVHPEGSPGTYLLNAGGSSAPSHSSSDYFCHFQAPVLQTVGYYFASQTPYFNYQWDLATETGPAPPLPGSPTFNVTSTSPLLITGFGQPITVSGWAKQRIANGYTNRFGYLEQYFDQAYTIGADGNPTTNSAGLLSPYGEFFPMQPGPAALLTMPDIDPPYQRGTGVVHVIKLALDVNHDGTMDLSYAGPDNTSQARPFAFWVNNNYDRLHWVDGSDLEQDDLERVDSSVYYNQTDGNMDCAFRGYEGKPAIPCTRDLEDYTRLWLPGMSSLMAVMPTNYTVKLTLNGDGQIRLFQAVEPDGGTNYLFDEVTASNQVAQSVSLYVGLLSSSSPIILSRTNFSEHFIWCGAARGSAEVHLQVLDGNQNTVADTAAYIELKDIKEMYERWTVGESASRGPYDTIYRAEDGLTNGMTAFQYGAPESTNTPYILYVHGWNMKTWEKDRFAETAFKRLYWQGYQGRFGVFRWPTDNGFTGLWDAMTDRRNYDRSEFNAWKSASLLSGFLSTNLCAKYPGHVYLLAHSMGNVVAGEALRLATSQIVNTYIASQAAVPAHTYDGTIAQYSFSYLGLSYGPRAPNIYSNWFTPNGLGAGRRINFYNTNDYALQRPRWELNQLLKPDQATTLGWTYLFDGAPHDNIQSYTPGPPDDTPPWDWFQKEKGYSRIFFNIVSSPTDRYEVMSYAAQSRSTALGRTPAVGNLNGNVELSRSAPTRIWPPDPDDQGANQYSRHKWHSAQFRSTNMRQKGYWQTLLSEEGFNIAP